MHIILPIVLGIQGIAVILFNSIGEMFIPYFVVIVLTSIGISNFNRKKRVTLILFISVIISLVLTIGWYYIPLSFFILIPRYLIGMFIQRTQEGLDTIGASLWVHSKDQLFIKNTEGRYMNVNASLSDFFNLSKDDIIGKTDNDIFEPEKAALYISSDQELLKTEKTKTFIYKEYRDGKNYEIQTIKQLLRDDDGKIIGILGIGRDMTEYYKAMNEERRINSLLNSLLDYAVDPIFVKDRNSVYTLVNKVFARYHNLEPSDIVGKNDYELYSVETANKFVERDKNLFETGEIQIYENKTELEGKMVYSITSKGPIYNEEGEITGIVGIAHNVTDVKVYRHQLLEAQKMESIGMLSSGIAHDLNNTLTSISGYLSLLERVLDDPESLDMVKNISNSTSKATALIKKLQLFSKRQAEEKSSVRVNVLIEDIIQIVRSGSLGKVEFKKNLSKEELRIDGEATSIQQVFMNLIVNAVEAIEERGTIVVNTAVRVISSYDDFDIVSPNSEPGEYVEIIIKDNGPGIDEDIREKLFDPFVSSKKKGTVKGTGLGLSIVYGIIMSHRGLLKVETSPQGTEFKVYFPSGKIKVNEAIDVQRIQHGSGVVLVIEDEVEIGKFLERALSSLGYIAYIFNNGEDGLKKFTELENENDLIVILDYILPGIKGDEIFREIIKKRPLTKIIMSSGYIDEGVLEKLKREGLWKFLPKPFDLTALSHALYH